MEVSMAEAAQLLGLSIDTVRRRLHRGELQGRQEPTAQGFRWWVAVPDKVDPCSQSDASLGDAPDATSNQTSSDPADTGDMPALREVIEVLQAQVKAQQEQLAVKDQQIEQLHVLLQQAQAALPAPRDNRLWWRFWKRG
jgi:hypothetical protein